VAFGIICLDVLDKAPQILGNLGREDIFLLTLFDIEFILSRCVCGVSTREILLVTRKRVIVSEKICSNVCTEQLLSLISFRHHVHHRF
jgi:hypothetical protein